MSPGGLVPRLFSAQAAARPSAPAGFCLVLSGRRGPEITAAREADSARTARGGLDTLVVSAAHLDILHEPVVAEVGDHVERCLREAEALAAEPPRASSARGARGVSAHRAEAPGASRPAPPAAPGR